MRLVLIHSFNPLIPLTRSIRQLFRPMALYFIYFKNDKRQRAITKRLTAVMSSDHQHRQEIVVLIDI